MRQSKANIIVARLKAKGAAAAAAALVVSASGESSNAQPHIATAAELCSPLPIDSLPEFSGSQIGSIRIEVGNPFREWDNALEREFRKLVLAEVSEKLTVEEKNRLEFLSVERDRLRNPLDGETALYQIHHDRVIKKMHDALREYIEFQEIKGSEG